MNTWEFIQSTVNLIWNLPSLFRKIQSNQVKKQVIEIVPIK